MTRVAVHVLGHVQPVPMDGGCFRQFVEQLDADALAAPRPQRGPEKAAHIHLQ